MQASAYSASSGFGRFDSHAPFVWGAWIFSGALVALGRAWRFLSRRPAWPGHVEACQEPPLPLRPPEEESERAQGAA